VNKYKQSDTDYSRCITVNKDWHCSTTNSLTRRDYTTAEDAPCSVALHSVQICCTCSRFAVNNSGSNADQQRRTTGDCNSDTFRRTPRSSAHIGRFTSNPCTPRYHAIAVKHRVQPQLTGDSARQCQDPQSTQIPHYRSVSQTSSFVLLYVNGFQRFAGPASGGQIPNSPTSSKSIPADPRRPHH